LVAEVEFGSPQFVGQLNLQVELLAVQGLDFDRDFF
jgi:hypothetical protein